MTLNSDIKFEYLTLWFQKWHEELGALKSKVKIVLWWPFLDGLFMTLKNDAKFEEELTCALKNDVRNLANFNATLKVCTLIGFF